MKAQLFSVAVSLVVLLPMAGAATGPQITPFGIDLSAEDRSVKPGDDFFRYASGTWLARTQIPPDQSLWGSFVSVAEKSREDVHALIEGLLKTSPAAGSNEQKIRDFYSAFLDTQTIDARGLAPARPGLDAIAHLKTHAEVAALIATPGMPLDGPVSWTISLDQKNPDRYVVSVGQSGLSLPDREYYLKTDAQFAQIRAKFKDHITKTLTLAGYADPAKAADQILGLETEIAKVSWDIARRRDRDATYNLRTVPALESEAPDYPWGAAFTAAGLPGLKEVVVAEMPAIPALTRLFKVTPVSTWQSYLTYHYLVAVASVLPKKFDQESFAFYGKTLEGQPEQRARWKRAVSATNGALGEAVGRLYVERYFPPEAKASALALVENLRAAYRQHIEHVSWMSADTKKVALEKLAAFRPKIGYPDRWRDYAALDVKPGDAFGNLERSQRFEWHRLVERLDKPTDRDEWELEPQEVNAYYNPIFNEVVFPAAILQPPFFDPKADPAVNYGGIGGIIGHEMGHGFDDQGAKSDAHGVLRTWWKPEDVNAFHDRTEALAAQYDRFEPLPGLHVIGHQTLGENIGDLGGLSIAYDAYLLSLKGVAAPVIQGITGDQRFFLGWAQAFRLKERDESLRNSVLSDVHSPAEFRVNGVVRNVDAWYAAFGVKPGDKLYLAPDERVRIW